MTSDDLARIEAYCEGQKAAGGCSLFGLYAHKDLIACVAEIRKLKGALRRCGDAAFGVLNEPTSLDWSELRLSARNALELSL